jgi:predicted XRE-type DNA-binding protein
MNDKKSIKDSIVTSKEVLQILDISRSRLSQLVKSGKLTPLKKNLYLLLDVLERKHLQTELREKYYRKISK